MLDSDWPSLSNHTCSAVSRARSRWIPLLWKRVVLDFWLLHAQRGTDPVGVTHLSRATSGAARRCDMFVTRD
eukprot:1118743-Pyramimonas_sp.AAC.1